MSTLTISERGASEAGRGRWNCAGLLNRDDVDEAIVATLAHADTVIVRTLDGSSFWAGRAPAPADVSADVAPWPPSARQRAAIDAAYGEAGDRHRAALEAAARHDARRDRWLRDHAPSLVGGDPAHVCRIVIDARGPSHDLSFAEYDATGVLCGAHDGAQRSGFGSARQAIAGASGCADDDPWVTAVAAALDRDRRWTRVGRRTALHVRRGAGEWLHASPARNRDSIAEHGLDWRRMSGTGIAGSTQPEAEGVFVCRTRDSAGFFIAMPGETCDLWAVDVVGLWLEGAPGADAGGSDAWMIVPQPLGPERVRLVERGG